MSSIRETLGVKPPQEVITWLNLLLYGASGAGKTYMLGTAQDHPDMLPLLIIDIEGGVVTLRKRPDIDVIQVRSMKKLIEVANELSRDTTKYYNTVGIDSLTELQKLDMRDVMKDAYNRNPEKVDIDVPSPREWGKNRERLTRIITHFKDLDCNFIMTALEKEEINETGRKSVSPSIPGGLRTDLPGFFDVVGNLRSVAKKAGNDIVVERILQTVKTEGVVAKDRTSELAALIQNPTLPLLYEMIHTGNGNTAIAG
jgi:hypothetical protein